MTDTKPLTLAEALAELQAALPDVGKGQTANAGTYSYSYADLADCSTAIMPRLAAHGLSFSAKPTLTEDGRFVLRYVLRHASGEDDGGDYPLPDPTKASAQQVGSAITYARRYTLCAVTGLAPHGEDDDGKAASQTYYEPPDEPQPPDPRTQLFSDVKAAGFARHLTEAEIADDFAGWSEGTRIQDATAEQLTRYVHHLKRADK
jgi:hypothetical protein